MKTDNVEYGSFVSRGGDNVRKREDLTLLEGEKSEKNSSKNKEFKNIQANKKSKSGIEQERKTVLEKDSEQTATRNQKTESKTATKKSDKKTVTKTSGKKASSSVKVKYSIGTKLILIISTIVGLSMLSVIGLASYYITNDTKVSAEENNLTINLRTASDVENRFETYISVVGMFYDNLSADAEDEELQNKAAKFFDRNKDIVAMDFVYGKKTFSNKSYFITREMDANLVPEYTSQETNSVDMAKQGNVSVQNATPFFNNQLLALFTPVVSDEGSDVVMILFSNEALVNSFSTGSTNLSFLVNNDGQILVHPDIELTMAAEDYSFHPLVAELIKSKNNNQQYPYVDENNVEYLGAYNKITAGCAVVTEVQTAILLEAVNATTRRNIYLTVAVMSLAIMIVWFFSKSLSMPLRELTRVTNEINAGNFETKRLAALKNKRKDEIGVLINSTKAEQEILNTFTRLTNKGVTKAIVTKKIDFKPHLKDITIFFSDIRGFTAISDGFNKRFGEKSAGEIISFLNDYMGRMVNCITISGGNVDKFEGDAIMACWGVLRDDNLDFERMPDSNPMKKKLKAVHDSHVKHDALSAIKATTAMRYALMEYNKKAELFTKKHEGEPDAKYKPHIRIGSGLNSGRATVGFMGSYDKMEFTSIGDAVNLASRTESSNKPCGTDMLITEDTYNLLKYDYIRCEENNFKLRPECVKNEVIVEMIPVTFEVKGKGKQHFYGVVNMPQFDIEGFFKKGDPNFKVDPDCAKAIGPKGPKTLAEVRSLLGIPTPDFGEVNLDAEENKIKAT